MSYLTKNITSIADRNLSILDEVNTVPEAAKKMSDMDTTSIFVAKKGSAGPVGIISRKDILYRVLTLNKDPSKTLLKDIIGTLISPKYYC